jgi:serine phosphatase RsbU (regulator of sigma subunit)
VWIRKDGTCEYLQTGGPALGMVKEATYETCKININSDDLVFFYTDGVTETMDINKQEYGEYRLVATLKSCRHQKTDEIINTVLDDLFHFSHIDSVQDDRTMLVLKV